MDMTTTCVVCGKKYHQKKLFHHHSWSDYKDIYEEVMNIDPNIRLVTICDMAGRIKYSDHRKNVVNLLSLEESKKSLKLAIDAWKIRRELAPKIGKGKYVLAEYERIKR